MKMDKQQKEVKKTIERRGSKRTIILTFQAKYGNFIFHKAKGLV